MFGTMQMNLVEDIYKATKSFPKEEVYGLTSQIRRSAVSIPSNIAEGFMRKHTRAYLQFLYIALGSLGELDAQMEIAKRVNYCGNQTEHDRPPITDPQNITT